MNGRTILVNGYPVNNVLITPGDPTELSDFSAVKEYLTLYFPRNYEDGGTLLDAKINIDGNIYRTEGATAYYTPESIFGGWLGSWDTKTKVYRIIPRLNETLYVYTTVVSRNYAGERTEADVSLYIGKGQARPQEDTENTANGGTEATRAYKFVIPWIDELKQYELQKLYIDYDSKKYKVSSVQNYQEQSEWAVIVGECHE